MSISSFPFLKTIYSRSVFENLAKKSIISENYYVNSKLGVVIENPDYQQYRHTDEIVEDDPLTKNIIIHGASLSVKNTFNVTERLGRFYKLMGRSMTLKELVPYLVGWDVAQHFAYTSKMQLNVIYGYDGDGTMNYATFGVDSLVELH